MVGCFFKSSQRTHFILFTFGFRSKCETQTNSKKDFLFVSSPGRTVRRTVLPGLHPPWTNSSPWSSPSLDAATTPNSTGQPERKSAFKTPNGTTTSTMALVVRRVIITDSSTASDANAPPWSLHDSDTQDKLISNKHIL